MKHLTSDPIGKSEESGKKKEIIEGAHFALFNNMSPFKGNRFAIKI